MGDTLKWTVRRGQYMSSVHRPLADGEHHLEGLVAFTYHEAHYGHARLIAAAPDLLAACEAALDSLVNEVADCSCRKVWEDDDEYVYQCAQCRLRAAIAKAKE